MKSQLASLANCGCYVLYPLPLPSDLQESLPGRGGMSDHFVLKGCGLLYYCLFINYLGKGSCMYGG